MITKSITEIIEEQGFKEVNAEALRRQDFKEIIEYYNGKVWRTWAK